MKRLAALAAATLALCGCYREIDARFILGSQGYNPQPRLLFERWRRQLTFNQPWHYKPLEYATAATNEDGSRVYVGSREGELSCWAVRRGRKVWRLNLKRAIRSEVKFHEGTLYFGTADGRFYAVDAEDGTVRWKYQTKGEVLARPVVTEDRVYITSTDHTVHAVSSDSGKWVWHYTRPVPEGFTISGQGGPLVYKKSIYVGFADGYLVSLKKSDGAVEWEKKLAAAPRFSDVNSTPVIAGGALLTSTFQEGIFSLDPEDGLIRWKLPVQGASTPAIVGDVGYVTTAKGTAMAFSLKTGKALWRSRAREGSLSAPVVFDRYVLFSQSRIGTIKTHGGIWVLDRQSAGVKAVVDVGAGVRGLPVVGGKHLFFLTDSGWFYGYRFGVPR